MAVASRHRGRLITSLVWFRSKIGLWEKYRLWGRGLGRDKMRVVGGAVEGTMVTIITTALTLDPMDMFTRRPGRMAVNVT